MYEVKLYTTRNYAEAADALNRLYAVGWRVVSHTHILLGGLSMREEYTFVLERKKNAASST